MGVDVKFVKKETQKNIENIEKRKKGNLRAFRHNGNASVSLTDDGNSTFSTPTQE